MRYQITPAQKRLLVEIGADVNFNGDDNDFSCYLSNFALDLFAEGNVLKAFECFENDPMAVYGVTFNAWQTAMKQQLKQRVANERTMAAHDRAMTNAG